MNIKTIQLLWVYHSNLNPDSGLKPHTHEYYHLLCVRKGELQFTLASQDITLQEGDLVIVPKDTVHSFRNDLPSVADYYEIKFSILSPALSLTLSNCGRAVWSDPFAFQLVEHIASEYQLCRNLSDESAAAALNTLVFHLTSESRVTSQSEPPVINTTGFTPLSKKVVDYITLHFSKPLTLDDISAGVGTSKNYLCNAFKRNTGITILDCLNMVRVRKAAELIVYSDLSLSQVASQCGYVSTSHFNRVFSRYAGIPPGQCRRAFSFSLVTKAEHARRSPGSFMYSVLAGKSISPRTIDEFESTKSFPED